MYAAIKDDEIIAFHEEKEVVRKFTTSFKEQDIKIVKIKKHKEKSIRKNPSFDDLYLVRYNDNYLPLYLYMVADKESEEINGDLKYCRDILCRILRTEKISGSKETKSINKVIKILNGLMRQQSEFSYSELREIKEMRDSYRNNIDE